EERGDVLEDGFLVRLHDPTWLRLRGALQTGQPFSLSGLGGPLSDFTLAWGRETYTDPVRKNVYQGGGMLQVAHPPPEAPAQPPDGVVDWKAGVLLNDAPLDERLGSDQALADFELALHKAIQDHFSAFTPAAGEDVALDCHLRPGGPPFFEVAM